MHHFYQHGGLLLDLKRMLEFPHLIFSQIGNLHMAPKNFACSLMSQMPKHFMCRSRLGDLWQCHADIQMLILLQEAYPKLSSAPARVLMVTLHVCSLTSHGLAQHNTYVVMYSLQAS